MKQEKITENDRLFLKAKLRQEKKGIYTIFFIALISALCLTFLTKGRKPSLYEKFGFLIPFIIFFILLFVTFFFQHEKSISKLKKDIISQLKVVEKYQIIDKDTSMKNEYLITLNSPIKNLQKHKIEKSRFTNIRIGDSVTVEYLKNSEIFLKINFA